MHFLFYQYKTYFHKYCYTHFLHDTAHFWSLEGLHKVWWNNTVVFLLFDDYCVYA